MKNIHRVIKPKLSTKYPFLGVTFLLQKCINRDQLSQVLAHFLTTGLIHHLPLASKLVASFASLALPGTTSVARSIADRINGLDTYTWNTIIRGVLEANDPENALLVYSHVRKKGLKPDTYTLLFVVKACGLMPMISEEKQIHAQIVRMGFTSEIIIQTALLNAYGSFGKLADMQQMFDEMPQRDLVAWNSLVAAYAQQNCPHKALAVLKELVTCKVNLNGVTVTSVLYACSSLKSLKEGKAIHGYVSKKLVNLDVFVYNSLIGMYSKCGYLLYAHRIFQMMPKRNVVSWTTMIKSYSDHMYPNEALALFKEMDYENVKPDEITVLGVIALCSKLGSFELGEKIDHYAKKHELGKGSVPVANALIDMHAKCGNIKKSCQIFDGMEKRTLVSWTSIIHGLALHGHGISALVRFCQMQREGFEPDEVFFLSILSACSHAGLVEEGRKCFDSMRKDYHIEPWMEHYGCMVDLLCRAGLINEALEFILNMPVKPDLVVWRTLLNACQRNRSTGIATQVMDHFHKQELESEDYVLLSNLYATMGDWDNVVEVRNQMEDRRLVKQEAGYTAVEVNQEI